MSIYVGQSNIDECVKGFSPTAIKQLAVFLELLLGFVKTKKQPEGCSFVINLED
ncbi:MAG: hypothetical protein O9274_12800 [Limnobacter sp.]|uniref:hypothetical protein n=1 Tax=Limnobacter sp. TaxID=2003368 RepID=UPI0022CCA2DA|nr:hypothetical protein [Limnobacter sp.]MCZ8016574.1 hypothetical protein [Limnobacter sp.]